MSTADPTILDPGGSILVKGNGSLRPALPLKYAFVEDQQCQKQNDRAKQPPWRHNLTRKTQPNREDKQEGRGEPSLRNPKIQPFIPLHGVLPGIKTGAVFQMRVAVRTGLLHHWTSYYLQF